MNNIITNANGVKVKVRVYDFGDKTADRYTIVCVSGKSNNHNNVMYYPIFSCSSNPFHPQGIAMYVGIITRGRERHTISVKGLRI